MNNFVRNCQLCEVPMKSSPFLLCPECLQEKEQVRVFLKNNPRVSLHELVESTQVPISHVRKILGIDKKI